MKDAFKQSEWNSTVSGGAQDNAEVVDCLQRTQMKSLKLQRENNGFVKPFLGASALVPMTTNLHESKRIDSCLFEISCPS